MERWPTLAIVQVRIAPSYFGTSGPLGEGRTPQRLGGYAKQPRR